MRVQELLARIDLFQGLPSSALDDLVQRGSTRQSAPGRVIIEQGALDSGLQLIMEGSATVSVNGYDVATLGAGDYLGEISLIDGAPRSATVTAGPDGVRTFAVSPLAFSAMLDADPHIARSLLPVITARLRRIEAALAAQRD